MKHEMPGLPPESLFNLLYLYNIPPFKMRPLSYFTVTHSFSVNEECWRDDRGGETHSRASDARRMDPCSLLPKAERSSPFQRLPTVTLCDTEREREMGNRVRGKRGEEEIRNKQDD